MMWVGVLLGLGTVVWFLWAVKHERSERIEVRELQALVELAGRNTWVAVALAHREAIRDTRGDPDGTDPVITVVDRCVREVARTSQRLLRAKARRDRTASRQAALGAQASRSVAGSESGDKAVDANVGALGEKVEQLDEALGVLEGQVQRMVAHLARVRETEQAKLAARLRPRPSSTGPQTSGLQRLASRAAQVVREVTQPRGRLVSASGAPVTGALSEVTSAPRPAPVQRAPVQATDTVPDAAPVRAASSAPRPPSRPRAPAAAALGRNQVTPDGASVNKASPSNTKQHKKRRSARGKNKASSGRQAIGRIEVRTSPAVKPLSDRSDVADPERTVVQPTPIDR